MFGHTHRPLLTLVDVVVTVMNPGGAGARRFNLPPSVGILELEAGHSAAGPAASAARFRSGIAGARGLDLRAPGCGSRHAPDQGHRASAASWSRPPTAPATVPRRFVFLPARVPPWSGCSVPRTPFFVAATIPDTHPYWGDDFVLSLDTQGRWRCEPRSTTTSSCTSAGCWTAAWCIGGRNGRWEPPQGDPDWRLGRRAVGWWVGGERQSGRPGLDAAAAARPRLAHRGRWKVTPARVPNLR